MTTGTASSLVTTTQMEDPNRSRRRSTHPTTTTTKILTLMSAGSLSGTMSAVVTQPFDVIKTNMINTGEKSANRSMVATCKQIYCKHGIGGLWRGTVPTIYRVFPGAAIYFSMLDSVSHLFQIIYQYPTGQKHSNAENFMIGFLARTCATTIMCPITVLKTRFELSTNPNMNVFRSLSSIYYNEGMRGLFSGLIPTLARDAPYAGVSYLCFKQLQSILTTVNDNSSFKFNSFIDPVAGGTAGMIGAVITYPFDVIRTRLQLHVRSVSTEPSPGVLSVFKTLLKNEGFLSLFRGMIPRLCKRTVASAISWTMFEFSNGHGLSRHKGNSSSSMSK